MLRSGKRAAVSYLEIYTDCLEVFNFHVEELNCYAVGLVEVLVHNNSIRIIKNWRPVLITDPRMLGDCERVADKILKFVKGDKYVIKSRFDGANVGKFRDHNWVWKEHIVVVKDGVVRNATTGCKGLPLKEYQKLFEDAVDLIWRRKYD